MKRDMDNASDDQNMCVIPASRLLVEMANN